MFLKKIIRGFYFLVILFLVVLTLKPVFASSTTSNWWDSSYGFRKKLSLTASKSNLAEGYQAEFTIDTKALFDAGSLRADGRDLKLVYHDGATATELNYSVETPQTLLLNTIDNSGTTILVDDVNNFPATGKIIINNEVISYTSLDTKAIASPAAVLPGAGGATANINDGSLTTLSDTYPGDASGYDWYSLTWSEARTFNRVRFKEKAYFDGWIVSYNIQYWNGSDWVNVANSSASKTLPANGTDGTVVNVRFDEVSTTKLRIYALTGGAATFIGLYEFEAYYSPAVTNQAKTTNSLGGIARAQNSTTAASHNAGTKVKLAPSSFTTTKLKFKVKKTIQPEETDDNYYLYYGKSDQSTASGTSVFLTEDDFTSDTLNSAWTWTTPIAGPTKSVVQSTNSGYFNAVLPSTGTFDFWYWTDEAPTFLRSPPLGDWSIETKVSLEDDETCCSHAGIMVKFNAWVAYMWGFYYGGSPVARSLEFDKTGTVLTNVSGYTAKQVYLRVRKVARTYYFDYKQNYTDAWTNAGSDSSVAFGVPISLGFYEKSWSDKPYTSTFFDDYKLTKYVYPNDSTIYSVSLDTERPYNTTASTVSAANSKIEVSPSTVVLGADYSSAFTVTVVDTYGDPISGKIVSVSSSRSGDVVSLDSTSSDSNGQITGSVMSAASGTSVLTATAGSTTITGTASVTFTTKEPYDFTAFGKLLRLPYFHSDSTVEEWTSHDQTGGNTDTGGYLSRDGTEYVIADEKGSGVVSHIWLVASDADLTSMGNLKIYVDGSATPSLNYSIANFFGGANSPLFIPLVDNNIGSSGGFYSYLQIPYTTALKITTTGPPKYYHIGLRKFSNSTDVTAFSGSENPTTQKNILANAGADFKSTLGNTIVSGSTTLSTGNTANILNISGTGSVQSIKLTIAPQTADALNNTYIKAYWDGEATPSINAPLSYFFGSGNGQSAVKALPFGVDTYTDTNQYYFYLPMPYKTAAKIDIVNSSSTDITTLTYEVQYKANIYQNIGTATGYLKTNFVDASAPAAGTFYTALDVTGRGQMVGIVYKINGWTADLMEGDNIVRVDGSLTPQVYGTGTEDFFFGGWGFNQGNFTTPLHGNPSGSFTSQPITMYKAMLTNPISFQSSLKFQFEHGPTNNIAGSTFSSLVFYYLTPSTGLNQTDTLDVGNTASENSHSYVATDITSNISSTSYKYEGDDTNTDYSDNGRQLTDNSQFTVTLSSTNKGVLLRRRSDYSVADQKATVSIDGTSAGTWYTPGSISSSSTMRWRDNWFYIPSSLTQNKTSATIKITNTGTSWNEFYYWVYSVNDLVAPRQPSGLSGSGASTSSITWSWTDNSDNETGFYIRDASGNTKCTVATAGATSCTETGLSEKTAYTRYVVSYNSNGNSPASGNAAASTLSTASSITSSSPSAPDCTDQKPGLKAPWLYGALTQNSSSVLLHFTESSNPVDKYILEYGTSLGKYKFGVLNMGVNSQGQMTYLVKSLSPNTTYYFRVRGGNGCAAGTWSNEISAKTKGLFSTNQLAFTSSELIPQPNIEKPASNISCQTYTVKPGDSLWNIASKLLGAGGKYKDIINQNKDKFPSLETSNNLNTGWELKVNCSGNQTIDNQTTKAPAQGGYDVKVNVVDNNKKPVEGATVTMHSTPQTAKTDKSGAVLFHNVGQGEHQVIIAYSGFQGEQSVNLTGDIKEFNLNVTVKPQSILLSPVIVIGTISLLALIIVILVIIIVKARQTKGLHRIKY